MIDKLLVVGCGWAHGTDLQAPPANSFPELVATHFGLELIDLTSHNATLATMYLELNKWIIDSSKEIINSTIILVALTDEARMSPQVQVTPEENYAFYVNLFDMLATNASLKLLQFKILSKNYKIKVQTLLESTSALEKLVIRNKPRAAPLFSKNKYPNEHGHIILSEYLIPIIENTLHK